MNQLNTAKQITASGVVKTGGGYVHAITISATGTVTAGTLTLYDNTAASGTILWSGIAQVGLNPVTILVDGQFNTGLYLSLGSSANVVATVSYR